MTGYGDYRYQDYGDYNPYQDNSPLVSSSSTLPPGENHHNPSSYNNYNKFQDVTPSENTDKGISQDSIKEASYLFIVATLGFCFNLAVIVCIVTCKHLRRMTSAFIVHGCALDMLKCLYCVPFATSLLKNMAPTFCTVLGGSYVVVVTASGFNIVAMICCEAYTFSEHNVGGEGKGSFCCVIFGIVMVYIGSVIIHLGPTIIGGDFNYNKHIGNCIFVYGTIKSYVVHAMWIVIMTIAMVGAIYYLCFFYRHVQANSTHRLASLVRASIQISQGNSADNNQNIRKIVRDSLSRTRVLITITVLFILSWYPLFILTLADPKFRQPSKIYKHLTFLAWSNAAINPLVYILFDRNINLFRRFKCCGSYCSSNSEEATLINRSLFSEPSARRSTSIGECLGVGQDTDDSGPATSSADKRPTTLEWPGVLYERVGCRLCEEGQLHTTQHCNGGVSKATTGSPIGTIRSYQV